MNEEDKKDFKDFFKTIHKKASIYIIKKALEEYAKDPENSDIDAYAETIYEYVTL